MAVWFIQGRRELSSIRDADRFWRGNAAWAQLLPIPDFVFKISSARNSFRVQIRESSRFSVFPGERSEQHETHSADGEQGYFAESVGQA